MPIPEEHGPYSRPHPEHATPAWQAWAAQISTKLLSWDDVRQLSVFGRYGYYVSNYLFATVPIAEPVLEVWMRLAPAEASELEKNVRASRHEHPVQGWMRYRVDEEANVAEALQWLEKAYQTACRTWDEGVKKHAEPRPEGGIEHPLGVPIHLVPAATGKPDHKIPQGPRSGRFVTGLAVEGADPQPG